MLEGIAPKRSPYLQGFHPLSQWFSNFKMHQNYLGWRGVT